MMSSPLCKLKFDHVQETGIAYKIYYVFHYYFTIWVNKYMFFIYFKKICYRFATNANFEKSDTVAKMAAMLSNWPVL